MAREAEDITQEKDGAVSWILAGIWLLGLIAVRQFHADIPLTMLVTGTIFFLALIPTMKEIVRSLQRVFTTLLSDKID